MGSSDLVFSSLDELPADPTAPAPDAGAFVPGTVPAQISFAVSEVPPAQMPGVYITPADTVLLTAWNSNPALTTLTAQLRLILPDGTVQLTQLVIPALTADRTANTASVSQVEGFLVGVVIGPPGVAVVRGTTYATVAIVRGAPPTLLTTCQLVGDYVTSGFLPGWPFSTLRSAVDGHGALVLYRATAVGVSFQLITQPAAVRWRIVGLEVTLTTVAAAGARLVHASVAVPAGPIVDIQAPATQGPGVTQFYTWGAALPYSSAAGGQFNSAPFPNDFIVGNGANVEIVTVGAQPGDTMTFADLLVEEWIDV